MKKIISLFIVVVSLSACSSLPNGKLTKSFEDVPVKADIVKEAPERPLYVNVPQTNLYGAGLIGAAVSMAATEVSRQKRLPGINEIRNSFPADKVFQQENDNLIALVKHADWIEPQKILKLEDYSASDRKAVKANALINTEAPYVVSLTSSYVIGEHFENLAQATIVKINKIENGKSGMKVFQGQVSGNFVPPGVAITKDMTNYRIWTANDNALLKQGITSTNNQVEKALEKLLLNPYQVAKIKNN